MVYSLIFSLFLDHHIILLWLTNSFWTIILFFFDLPTLFGPSYHSSLIYLLFLDHHMILLWFTYSFWTIILFFFDLPTLFLDHHIILLCFTNSFWTIILFFFDLLTLFWPSYDSSLICPKRVGKSKKNHIMVQKELVNQRRMIWWSKKSN
jgi:hypothetical protein